MAQQPQQRIAPGPNGDNDYDDWPDAAKRALEKCNALNDSLTRVNSDQNRIIQGLRGILDLDRDFNP